MKKHLPLRIQQEITRILSGRMSQKESTAVPHVADVATQEGPNKTLRASNTVSKIQITPCADCCNLESQRHRETLNMCASTAVTVQTEVEILQNAQ